MILPTNTEQSFITDFFKHESAAGILLIIAAALAIVIANTPLNIYYELLIDTPVSIRVGALSVDKPLLLWVNDGLMAMFFFMVGLELKREMLEGELSSLKKVVLPGLGAVGGMVVPALIYVLFNLNDPQALNGWAIPAATDIAFALGILLLLGSRVPSSLKVFLVSLAIFDDIGAVIIIAIFYTSKVSLTALIIAGCCIVALAYLNWRNVVQKSMYVAIGLVMWLALLKSGVHATLAGVIIAMFIPLYAKDESGVSPLKSMEDDLHSAVAFFVLPVFAFCNAGIDFTGMGVGQILHPIPLGIALGLFLGKQLGIFAFCWIGIKLGIARLPDNVSMFSLYGVAVLCGIGFTMSLFIGSLAFEESGLNQVDERLGILVGSLLSGIMGYMILRKSLPGERQSSE